MRAKKGQTEAGQVANPRRDWDAEEREFRHRWALGFLIVLAAALRVYHLDRPAISADEAGTYARTAGTFSDLVESLREEPRGPLHDELYWSLGKVLPLNPWVLRSSAALAGAAMVAAMYWLGRQIVNPQGALLAAALAACSALLLAHSRQSTAAMETVLMSATNVASLLWWLRGQRAVAYLAWLAGGVALVGLDRSGVIVLALEPLFAVTYLPDVWRKRRLVRLLLVVLMLAAGVGVIGSGAAYSAWVMSGKPAARESGMQTRTSEIPQKAIAQVATGHLIGWEWPTAEQRRGVDSRAFYYLSLAVKLVLGSLLLALLPWKKLKPEEGRPFRPWAMAYLPRVSFSYQRVTVTEPQPVWRRSLWLLSWIVLPVCLLDGASMQESARGAMRYLAESWPVTFGLCAGLSIYGVWWVRKNHPVEKADVREQIWPMVQLVGAIFVVALLCVVVRVVAVEIELPALGGRAIDVIWPAVALGVSWLIMRIGFKWLRRAAVAVLLGANLLVGYELEKREPEPRIDLIARDVIDAQQAKSPVRSYIHLIPKQQTAGPGAIYSPVGKYYLSQLSGKKLTPAELRAGMVDRTFKIWTAPTELSAAVDAKRLPWVARLVLWDMLDSPTPPGAQPLSGSVDWKLVRTEEFPALDHWTWRRVYTLRRREYLNVTRPASTH